MLRHIFKTLNEIRIPTVLECLLAETREVEARTKFTTLKTSLGSR